MIVKILIASYQSSLSVCWKLVSPIQCTCLFRPLKKKIPLMKAYGKTSSNSCCKMNTWCGNCLDCLWIEHNSRNSLLFFCSLLMQPSCISVPHTHPSSADPFHSLRSLLLLICLKKILVWAFIPLTYRFSTYFLTWLIMVLNLSCQFYALLHLSYLDATSVFFEVYFPQKFEVYFKTDTFYLVNFIIISFLTFMHFLFSVSLLTLFSL